MFAPAHKHWSGQCKTFVTSEIVRIFRPGLAAIWTDWVMWGHFGIAGSCKPAGSLVDMGMCVRVHFFIGDTLLSLIMRQHCCTGEQRSACRLGTPPLHLGPDCARGGSRQCASSSVAFRLRPPQPGAHCSQCIESVPQLRRIQEKLGGRLAEFCAWIVWIPS